VSDPEHDPVRARRARVARLATIGQRVGYLLYAVAAIAFFIGLASGFGRGRVVVIEICLLVGSLLLAPSIVLAFAVRAAERDDREHGR
jgi:hypothetical protein